MSDSGPEFQQAVARHSTKDNTRLQRGIRAAVATGAGGAVLAGALTLASAAQEMEKGEHRDPNMISLGGIVEIMPHPPGHNPLDFRDRSHVTSTTQAPNIIPQDEVDLPDGKSAAGVDSFFVSNYLLEQGSDQDGRPTTFMVFPDENDQKVYIPLDPNHWDYWDTEVAAVSQPGKLNPQGDFVLDSGKVIPHEEIGQISLENPVEVPTTS
ncbi:MAG: hypothetical protein HYV38_00670 [Candidatus Levybacteria bacterium]|nr:hypothetical protein [Candidatus Levybacteria bacterium]